MNENNVPTPGALPPATPEAMVAALESMIGIISDALEIDKEEQSRVVGVDEILDRIADLRDENERLTRVLSAQPPAPVQQTEAVAWQVRQSKAGSWGPATTKRIADHWESHGYEVRALYATPPAPATALPPVARVPLTRDRILALWGDRSDGPPTHQIISFARAVEASTGEQSHG